MPNRHIALDFPDDDVVVRVELLEDEAPKTCDGIWSRLPLEGTVVHGIYSGSEAVLMLDPKIKLPKENLTTRVLPGEIGYTFIPGGEFVGTPNDIAELALFYGRDARPHQPDGPWPVNLFARVVEGFDSFVSVCRATRYEGVKRAIVRRM